MSSRVIWVEEGFITIGGKKIAVTNLEVTINHKDRQCGCGKRGPHRSTCAAHPSNHGVEDYPANDGSIT